MSQRVSGIARSAKSGPCVVGNNGAVFYLPESFDWNDLEGKQVTVRLRSLVFILVLMFLSQVVGELVSSQHDEPLKNAKGEYSAGMSGQLNRFKDGFQVEK